MVSLKPYIWHAAMMNTRQRQLMNVLLAGLVFVGVLVGLAWMDEALPQAIYADGVDRAMPGDEVGELNILSTRELFINWEGMVRLGLGLGLILATLGLGWGAQQRLKRLSDAPHIQQSPE